MAESESDLSLDEVLEAAAEGLDMVTPGADDRGTTWSVGSVAFAALAGDTAEFRLDPKVASAALRTPDAAPSPRGPDWVAFRPPIIDDGAADRAEAWFLSAARRAAGSAASGRSSASGDRSPTR